MAPISAQARLPEDAVVGNDAGTNQTSATTSRKEPSMIGTALAPFGPTLGSIGPWANSVVSSAGTGVITPFASAVVAPSLLGPTTGTVAGPFGGAPSFVGTPLGTLGVAL
jgi:hypothetical protein